MGKDNFIKAKKKSKDYLSPKKSNDSIMAKNSNVPIAQENTMKCTPKNDMKKKRKRSLVSANDTTYADCFSDTEDAFKEKWNGSSLDEAVKAIMSEGGSLHPNGSLLRPGKPAKKKPKMKDPALKPRNKGTSSEKNCQKMNSEMLSKRGTDCADTEKLDSGCTAHGHPRKNSVEISSSVLKKQKKKSDINSDCDNKADINGKDGNFKPNKKFKEEKTSNNCSSSTAKLKNDSVKSLLSQNCNDEEREEISIPKKPGQSLKKTKNKEKIDPSFCVEEKNDEINETFKSSHLAPNNSSSPEDTATTVENDATSDLLVCINQKYSSKSFCKKFQKLWRDKDVEDLPQGSTILHAPFNCAHLTDFIHSDCNFLDRLKKELRTLPFTFRNNDIFKFRQSGELPLSGACLELRQLLMGPVRDWLISTTRIPLADTVDLSASLYLYSDALLCHDDELEGRRIAFILYLTDESDTWQPSDGGSLDLFDGEPGLAGRLVKRLYPHLNTFAFFEVSPRSFHQVSEVLSPTKARLSVSGWFHGPPIHYPPSPIRPPKLFFPPGHVEESVFFSWVSPVYLAESLQCSIRRQLAQDSEIQLETFFVPEKFEELSKALRSVDSWSWAGPPTSAHYEVCGTPLPDVVREFVSVTRSEAFFLVLAQLTGVALHRLAPPDEDDGGDESCSDGGEGSNSEDEEADGEHEEPKIQALKRILKHHKKKESFNACKKLGSISEGLGEMWSYDLGLPLSASPEDLTTAVSDDVVLNKKKNKKSKKAKLEQAESTKSSENLGKSSDKISKGSCASSLCSIRRLSHGCYSLIRDDDNNDGGNAGSQKETPLTGQEKILNRGASASQDKGSDSRDSTVKNGNCVNEVSGKKKKNLSDPGDEQVKRSKTRELEDVGDSDTDDGESYVLDVSLFCNVPDDWSESYGGYTAYVGQHDQEQLLSVVPRNNCLALVYRDLRTHSFIKHINVTAGAASFHQIFCQYKES